MKLYSNIYTAISLLNAPKIDTDLLWDLTILFGSIAIVYFTAIFFFRNKITGKSRKVSAMKKELSPMISEFIFYEDSASKEEKSVYINLKVQIRDMLRDDFTRQVVSEVLLDLRKDVSGSAQERLFALFQDLDLHKQSYKKLKSWRWEQISRGIQELTRMEVSDSYEFIAKFVNDKRGTIRKQAEIGVVTLKNEGINYFLDTTWHKISEWQQLKLMEVLSNKTDFVAPSFMAWLTSTNKYVVLFALRLIKYYDQNDAKASIIELVKHRDNQIKQEAIDCIEAFYITDALPVLKQVFSGCSTTIKISILGTIGKLGTTKDIPFLKSIGNKERNYSVTSKGLSAINAIAPESILPTEGISVFKDVQVPDDIVVEEPVATSPDSQENETTEQVQIGAETAVEQPELKEEQIVEVIHNSEPPIALGAVAQDEMPSPQTAKMKSKATPEDIRAMEVIFSTDFIPLVTEKANQEQTNANEITPTPIHGIGVVFEEIPPTDLANKSTEKPLNNPITTTLLTDSDFLPIVVSEEKESAKPIIDIVTLAVVYEIVLPNANPIEDLITFDVNELVVDYEEIVSVTKEASVTLRELEVVFEEVPPFEVQAAAEENELELSLFDMEVVFNTDSPPLRIPKIVTVALKDIEVDVCEVETVSISIEEIEVVFEVVPNDDENREQELPEWLLNEIAKENDSDKNSDSIMMEGPEWEKRESEMMDKIRSYIDLLPQSDDNKSAVSETVQLLDDISLFGDEREISVLEELLQKEDKAATKKRIYALMKRFMGNDTYGGVDTETKPYSVFEELFRNCDTESKLILLDEIVSIGDQKEVLFLELLVNDSNKKIGQKAEECLRMLKYQLEKSTPEQEENDALEYELLLDKMELSPPKQTDMEKMDKEDSEKEESDMHEMDMFEIDFELTTEETEESPPAKAGWFSTLISKLTKKPRT